MWFSKPGSLEPLSESNALTAPFHTDTKLVPTIPTTIAAYAAVARDDNTTEDTAGLMAAIPDISAPTAADRDDSHRSVSRCPSLRKMRNSEAIAAVPALADATAQAGLTYAAGDSNSTERPTGNSSAKTQQVAVKQPLHRQPCKATFPTLDMFDEAEHYRHRQASKAASQVLAIQEQQLLWAAMSKGLLGGGDRTVPTWMYAAAGHKGSG